MAIAVGLKGSDYTWTHVFDETSFTMTSEEREDQIMQAITIQLSKSLESIKWIDEAIVTLSVDANQDDTYVEVAPSHASIVLTINSDVEINEEMIEGIVSLITGSVRNLDKENVTIVNDMGIKLN